MRHRPDSKIRMLPPEGTARPYVAAGALFVDEHGRAGNPSMKVKALLVMRRHGIPLPLEEGEIRAIVGRMQGEADENIAAAVIARLTSQ